MKKVLKKIAIALGFVLLAACASKPALQQTDIEGAVKTGQTSADVVSKLGLADAYFRLWNNNRVLVYNQTGLYFNQDQLSSLFRIDDSHAVNTVKANRAANFKCDVVMVMPSALAVQVAEQLKVQGVMVSEKMNSAGCVLSVEPFDAPAQPVLQSVAAEKDYNPVFYSELDNDYKKDLLNKAQLPVVKGLKASLKLKNQTVWNVEVISTSNLYDVNEQTRALVLALGWTFATTTPGPVTDVVFPNDARLRENSKKDKAQDVLALTKEAQNPLRAFAYLGDEAGFRAAVKAGVPIEGPSTDTDAFCLASRAGFAGAASDVVKAGSDMGRTVRDHRKGRSYISVKDCANLQSNHDTRAEIQRVQKENQNAPVLKTGAAANVSGDATQISADATKAESKGVDWDAVWEFLKPQVPAQKSTH